MKRSAKIRTGAASSAVGAVGAGGVWASVLAMAWLACSSESPHPALLGGCTAIGDASCSVVTGAGSGSGPGDGAVASDVASSESSTGCGNTVVTTMNTTCTSCLEANCCAANAACADVASCVALVQCAVGCTANNTSCVSDCFDAASAAAQSDYNDLSSCLGSTVNGCTGCPALPLQSNPDF